MEEVKLTITLKPDGTIEVDGPVENLIFCYGLLGMAKDSIQRAAMQRDDRAIKTFPSDGLPPRLI